MSDWDRVRTRLQALHRDEAALSDYCAFDPNLEDTPFTAKDHAIRSAFESTDFGKTPYGPLVDTLKAVAREAHWRLTYADTDIGADFLNRFGCYCLVGPNAPWTSDTMRGFVVFMPPGLWYPWHQHPADELYFVLAGEGEFHRADHGAERLRPGDAMFHAPNESHALRTTRSPVLAYVLWRGDFEFPPVWSPAPT